MILGTLLPVLRFAHVYVTIDEDGDVEPSLDATPLMIGVFQAKWLGLGFVFMYGETKPVPAELQ